MLNLTVDDVPGARRLLEQHFGMRPYGPGKKNFDVLFDDEGLVLTLIGAGRNNTVSYPETFHIGFMQATTRTSTRSTGGCARTATTCRRRAAQHGAWTFYFEAPGGFTIEVLC